MEKNKKNIIQDSQENKKSFFIKVKESVVNFEKYSDMMNDKIGNTIKYILQIMLIFTLILTAVSTYKFTKNFNKAIKIIKNDCKEYTFTDGVLDVNIDTDSIELSNNTKLFVNTKVDGQISKDKNVQKVKLVESTSTESNDEVSTVPVADDTNTAIDENNTLAQEENTAELSDNNIEIVSDTDKLIDELNKNKEGILVLKDKVILKDVLYSGLTEYDLSEVAQRYKIQNFDKAQLEQFIDSNYNTVVVSVALIIFIVDFFIYLIQLLLDAILLTILAFLVGLIVRVNLKVPQCFNIGIHALTLPLILNIIYLVINGISGFEISNFRWMYTTISYIYVIVAILMIKSDLTTLRKNVIKIDSEEEKIKEELAKKKAKEQEEQEKEDLDKRDKEAEDKEKKKEKKSGSKKEDKDQKPAADGALFEKTDEQ